MPKSGKAAKPVKQTIRGTIASSQNMLGLIVSTMAFLAERGNSAGVQTVARDIADGNIGTAFDNTVKEVQKTLFNGVEKPMDVDGKAVYVGMHPFKADAFGVYRTELQNQHTKNQETRAQVEARRAARKIEQDQKQAKAKEKAERRAADALAKAQKELAKAQKLADKAGVSLRTIKAEAATKSEADAALQSIDSHPSTVEREVAVGA